jgi:hypothetical protein
MIERKKIKWQWWYKLETEKYKGWYYISSRSLLPDERKIVNFPECVVTAKQLQSRVNCYFNPQGVSRFTSLWEMITTPPGTTNRHTRANEPRPKEPKLLTFNDVMRMM